MRLVEKRRQGGKVTTVKDHVAVTILVSSYRFLFSQSKRATFIPSLAIWPAIYSAV
jgi:hypothetical protein